MEVPLSYIKDAIKILDDNASRKTRVSMKYISAVSVIATKEGIVFIHSIFTRNNKTIMFDVSISNNSNDITYVVAYSKETKQISVYDAVLLESKDINLTEAEELLLLI